VPDYIGETLKIPENAPLPANWDASHPCADARPPTVHAHTFWADGGFNSYDQNDRQVDEGAYKPVNNRTFIFPGKIPITVHYRVDGDTIVFEPEVPNNCSSNPDCLGAIGYVLIVTFPGETWTRVTSGNNVPAGSG
jgi:hypothetical protein